MHDPPFLDMSRYDDAYIGRMVPVHADVTRALEKFVPHVARTESVRLLSTLRATLVSIQDKVVKYGYNVREVEADTMQFIARETRMPILKVYGVDKNERGGVFIVMEFVHGVTVETVWKTLSKKEKESLALELRGYMDDMRKLKGDYIGALHGLPCANRYKAQIRDLLKMSES